MELSRALTIGTLLVLLGALGGASAGLAELQVALVCVLIPLAPAGAVAGWFCGNAASRATGNANPDNVHGWWGAVGHAAWAGCDLLLGIGLAALCGFVLSW